MEKLATVVAKLRAVGEKVAFVPGWFTRVERRRSEFAGTVQGDFNVSSFSRYPFQRPFTRKVLVEWRLAYG